MLSAEGLPILRRPEQPNSMVMICLLMVILIDKTRYVRLQKFGVDGGPGRVGGLAPKEDAPTLSELAKKQ